MNINLALVHTLILGTSSFLLLSAQHAQETPRALRTQTSYEEVYSFPAQDATQGVAADGSYVYAISNSSITKFTHQGDSLLTWKEDDKSLIRHFDGGIIIDGLLYCSHSNFPEVPMASSIEVFDPEDLRHIKTISLGIEFGSCTWIVRGDDCWYACFAHYDRSGWTAGGEPLHDASWTQIVQFDNEFRRLQGYSQKNWLTNSAPTVSPAACSWTASSIAPATTQKSFSSWNFRHTE